MSADHVQPIPHGMHSLTPHLVCANAVAAIDFYRQAFGAEELLRLILPDGKLGHAMLRIGDSMLLLADEFPQWESLSPATLRGSPVTIHLAVEDVDAAFARAVAAGATTKMAPAEMFWGDRYGVLVDPFGHNWSLATHVRDVPVEEMRAEMEKMAAAGAQA